MELDRQALRWFVEVADTLHFGRAATSLGISRHRLSAAVVALEDAVGEPLFVRPSERTELTPAGQALRARADGLLAETDEEATPNAVPGLRVAIVPGVTVSKWTKVWAERCPDVPLRIVQVDEQDQVRALHEGLADVAFVRLPVDREGLSVIPLYAEAPVVVLDTDHVLTLLAEVSVVDLVDEHLLQDPDTVPPWREAAASHRTAERRPLPAMRDTADAIALVAAGVGVVIVPQSVARLHHRKDVTYRPVTDVDPTQVALAWPAEATTAQVEEFVGIVRGRSANSSRSPRAAVEPDAAPRRDSPARSASPRPVPARPGRPRRPGPSGGRRGSR